MNEKKNTIAYFFSLSTMLINSILHISLNGPAKPLRDLPLLINFIALTIILTTAFHESNLLEEADR